jgi:hypothetical protein
MTEMTPREKRIHAALRELIGEAGGCEEAGKPLGLKKAQMGRMNVDPPEAFMNIFQLSKLEAFVGQPLVSRVLAGMAGFDLVEREAVAPIGNPCINSSVAVVMGEVADLGKVYAELVSDGISPTDALLIDRELQHAAKAIEHARQACAAVQAKRKS